MFDISKVSIQETADCPVRDAARNPLYDDKGNPLTITFYGPASKKYQEIKHRNENRNSKKLIDSMQGKNSAKSSWSEKLEERAADLAELTISFNHFGKGDLKGRELYIGVYADITLGHIIDDAEKFLDDRANFTKPSIEG